MKLNLLFWITYLLLMLSACNATWVHGVKAIVENESSVPIKIYFFDGGRTSDSILISPSQTFTYAENAILGGKLEVEDVSIRPDFYNNRYFVRDSVVVVFDGLYRVTHYWDTIPPAEKPAKFFYYQDNRNFTNHDNFELEVKEKSRQTVDYIFTYTFTEEDYRFAKE
ncbi:hypothetical protein [Hugenholtzia roseola]|uniref:hypothetical protein n=1 Tax=Hugenholtzia roseola TaxID=1002 RepID=UPI0012B61A76|nr:hypothetical protein [Hugenholtzia roseola]